MSLHIKISQLIYRKIEWTGCYIIMELEGLKREGKIIFTGIKGPFSTKKVYCYRILDSSEQQATGLFSNKRK